MRIVKIHYFSTMFFGGHVPIQEWSIQYSGYPGTMGPTEILEPMIHFEFGSLLRDVCIYIYTYIYK
jgi:hypothetical protein